MTKETVTGWEQTIYNRPANVESIYSDQAKVRFMDNGMLGYVPLEALENDD